MTENKKRRIALTVDVEAHPIRAAEDHVNRLIWGRQNGREAGIRTMMDIADRHGVPMTFFLDYPEYELYGEALLDAGREIHRRGHDLEPHCHAEYVVKKIFGLDDEFAVRLPKATYGQARKIVDYLIEKHEAVTGKKPLAYRSGAYLIGPEFLKALHDGGIRLDASHNTQSVENIFPWGLRGNFFWENGLWEISVPLVPFFQRHNYLFPWNFNQPWFLRASPEECLRMHKNFLKTWFRRNGDNAVATMIMHSWSFWKMDPAGHFTIPADENIARFDSLIEELKKDYEFVALGDIARNPPGRNSLETVSFAENTGYCPVCYEPVSHFMDYNAPRRQCAFCKSVERQRTLVDLVYKGAFGPGIFYGKKVLHVAPGWPENLLLRRMHDCGITTLNIMPGCQLEADIQNMPELQDNSFDVVLASEVFRHVRNLEAGLSEICRVLKPGGILLASDCLENADYGREITDRAEQAAWYGEEKLDKYGIGDFRRFGRKDWPRAFEKYFHVRVFEANDKGTGSPAWWLAAVPKKAESADNSFSPEILASNAGRILHNPAIDPVGDFITGFDGWGNYRKKFFCQDIGALKKIILCVNFYDDEARPPKKADPDWPATYPESYYPFDEQSWRHLLPDMVDDACSGFTVQIDRIIKEACRWIDAYGFYTDSGKYHPYTRLMVWDDTAAASRLCIMAYMFARGLQLPEIGHNDIEKIFRSMIDHFLLLCSKNFFKDKHNHGWIQMYALLGFCKTMPLIPGTRDAVSLALERTFMLARKLTSAEGMLKEHTLSYHVLALVLLSKIYALASESGGDRTVLRNLALHIEKMRACTAYLLTPDGKMAPFGDADPAYAMILPEIKLAHSSMNLPESIVLKNAGYAVLRVFSDSCCKRSQSWLAMAGAFHSMHHKHCDELGFIWQESMDSILVDPGVQLGRKNLLRNGPLWEKGFYYSTPNRVYAESAHAHNVVEINGETWSRRLKPWGALPLDAEKLDEDHWLLAGEWQRPEGFLQHRRLIFAPNRWLLVIDKLDAGADASVATFTQWFHLDAGINLEKREDNTIEFKLISGRNLFVKNFAPETSLTLHKGEISPRLQGWTAEDSNSLQPSWALGIHATGMNVKFVTLFSLDEMCDDDAFFKDRIFLQCFTGMAETVLSDLEAI